MSARWVAHPDMPGGYRLALADRDGALMHVGGICEDTEDCPFPKPPGAVAWWWVGQRPVDGAGAMTIACGWATSHDSAERAVLVAAAAIDLRHMMTADDGEMIPVWEE